MQLRELAVLQVDSLTLEGEGAGELDGRTVFCRGVFPGERAEVQVEALSRHHARAHARSLRVLDASPARRVAPCPNHERREGRCAGCALMELEEPAQREAKRVMLQRFGLHVERIEAAREPLGYRYSSKRVAFASPSGLTLGSYAHRSHEPAPMPGCLVDHPRLVAAFAAVERAARARAIAPYDEANARGDLRYVWAKTDGEHAIVTLVTAGESSRVAELAPLLDVAGVLHSVQSGRGNSLRGPRSSLLSGRSELRITLLDGEVEVGALGFVQPNPRVAERAYLAATAVDAIAGRSLAFDLYAGAGLITRRLREHFREVASSELHPESARALGVPPESTEDFLARQHGQGRRPDLIVANPPRKGLGAHACATLLAIGAPHLHVMSCGPEGLARDLGWLAARYEIAQIVGFDTLPQTPHVELVAQLRLC